MKLCSTCLHTRCLFYGENRLPVYNGTSPQKTNCWDNAQQQLGQRGLPK